MKAFNTPILLFAILVLFGCDQDPDKVVRTKFENYNMKGSYVLDASKDLSSAEAQQLHVESSQYDSDDGYSTSQASWDDKDYNWNETRTFTDGSQIHVKRDGTGRRKADYIVPLLIPMTSDQYQKIKEKMN